MSLAYHGISARCVKALEPHTPNMPGKLMLYFFWSFMSKVPVPWPVVPPSRSLQGPCRRTGQRPHPISGHGRALHVDGEPHAPAATT